VGRTQAVVETAEIIFKPRNLSNRDLLAEDWEILHSAQPITSMNGRRSNVLTRFNQSGKFYRINVFAKLPKRKTELLALRSRSDQCNKLVDGITRYNGVELDQ
jgi:peptide methionine sulfoxide reductase MsrA